MIKKILGGGLLLVAGMVLGAWVAQGAEIWPKQFAEPKPPEMLIVNGDVSFIRSEKARRLRWARQEMETAMRQRGLMTNGR